MLLSNRGLARLFLNEIEEAGQEFGDALAICRAAGREDIVDETLLGLAAVEASRGALARAARLAGAAKRHETKRSGTEDAVWSRLNDIVAPARERFGVVRWDDAEGEGAVLSVRDAIDLGLARGKLASLPSRSTRART